MVKTDRRKDGQTFEHSLVYASFRLAVFTSIAYLVVFAPVIEIPRSAIPIATGLWMNAVLNTVVLVLLLIPLFKSGILKD